MVFVLFLFCWVYMGGFWGFFVCFVCVFVIVVFLLGFFLIFYFFICYCILSDARTSQTGKQTQVDKE